MRSKILAAPLALAALVALAATPALASKKKDAAAPAPAAGAMTTAAPAAGAKPKSAAQVAAGDKMKACAKTWDSMSPADKDKYNTKAKGMKSKKGNTLSGYNVWTGECMKKK
jgi:hypothetical protein